MRCLDTEPSLSGFFSKCWYLNRRIYEWKGAARRWLLGEEMKRAGVHIRIPGSCDQMCGHGLRVWVSGSQCKADEEDISSLAPRLWCTCVCVVLNTREQVVRNHPNTVAWQMAHRATCIPFRPPECPHHLTDQPAHAHPIAQRYTKSYILQRCGKYRIRVREFHFFQLIHKHAAKLASSFYKINQVTVSKLIHSWDKTFLCHSFFRMLNEITFSNVTRMWLGLLNWVMGETDAVHRAHGAKSVVAASDFLPY